MYTISELAKLAGVSTRTLRHYDTIGLLVPSKRSESAYRLYEAEQVDQLQLILFYKQLGFSLTQITVIMRAADFDREQALLMQLTQLKAQAKQLAQIITTLERTLDTTNGAMMMNDNEKFVGLKTAQINENEAKYGKEIRAQYGDAVIDASNEKFLAHTQVEFENIEQLTVRLNETLKAAVEFGDANSELAQFACTLHKQWLQFYWPADTCTPSAHLDLAQMYCDDERFRAHYEKIAPGTAAFLLAALKNYYR